MNVFGVGGMELVFILLIMLVVAGPKRMIRWAYILGQYTARLRRMWEETVDYLQKEIDEAGVDVKLPKEPPTRANLNRAISDAMKPITAPVQEALDEVDNVKKLAAAKPSANRPVSANAPAETPAETNHFGTWSGAAAPQNDEEQPS